MTEPEQKGERRKVIEDSFAQTPRLDIVYKIPPGNTPDWYALDVLGHVLSNGVSSRLYQKFVKEKELALSVYADANEQRGPSLFWFSIMARPTTDLGELETLLQDEIARLQNEPIADWELEQSANAAAPPARSTGFIAVAPAPMRWDISRFITTIRNLINSVWRKYEANHPSRSATGRADLFSGKQSHRRHDPAESRRPERAVEFNEWAWQKLRMLG